MPDIAEHSASFANETLNAESRPDGRALKDRIPTWFRMSANSSIFLLGLGMILVQFFGSAPLWHSDLWDHINYGQRILETRSVPTTEPLLPLAKGMPMINTAWGAQVIMAAIYNDEYLGLPGLQFTNGLLVIIALGAVGWAIWRQSGSVAFGVAGYVVFLILNWQQFLVIRPQLIGVTFFSVLLAVLATDATRRRVGWILLPLMFVAWANLHGSWAMGLTLFGLFTVGRFFDVALRTKSLRLAARSRSFWRLVLLIQVCSAAVLLNPNGIAVYGEVLRVGSHPNISSMYEWDPLTLRMKQGQATAVVTLLLLIVLRFSPRRLRCDQLLALLATGGLAMWSSRMINWFAPTAALVVAIHGAAVLRAWRKPPGKLLCTNRRGLWTIVNLGMCWIIFGFTTLGVQTIRGTTSDPRRSLSRATPVALGQYLAEEAEIPEGLVFAPAEWVGYLTNVRNGDFRPMVNLHVHLIPEEVWAAYLRLLNSSTQSEAILDRYGINVVIAQKRRNTALLRQLRESNDYQQLYEDAQSVVLRRKELIR